MEQEVLCPACQKPNAYGAQFCMYCGHSIILNDDVPSDDRRYYITRIIKTGGQGSVFAGVDQDGRIYAIKELLDRFTDPAERADATKRFNAEAQLLKKLKHPRIPRVYSHFTDEGRHYLTMDFVQGEDMESIIERETVIPERQTLEWAMQMCDVLEYLHAEGLIYRDVKPSNIMIEPDGNVKLVDFGIAKIFNPTEQGTQIGTPGYAPPEQYQGLATPVSDIFALAATLHHMLTGRDPTEQPPFSFPPARDVNINVTRRTSDALQQALKMDPKERTASIAELRSQLRSTDFLQQPAQVRVAPKTASLHPSSAQAGAPVQQHVPTPAPAPAAPAQPQPSPPSMPLPSVSAPSAPASPPAAPPTQGTGRQQKPGQASQTRQQRKGIGKLLFILVLILTLIGGAIGLSVYNDIQSFFSPQQEEPTLAPARPLPLEVEVLVPAGADDTAVLNALREAYRQEVQAQHPGAVISSNIPITTVGSWQQVGQEGGQVRYQATIQGYVALPQGP